MKTFTFLAMAAAASAHMIMKTPVPAGTPDSSPLLGDGSDYPCKNLVVKDPDAMVKATENVMAVGAPQTLSFTGSAVHGGGSCQVSLAKGTTISKDMKFMVIHSIEGGCPADKPGNIEPEDPNGNGAGTFQFSVPDHPDLGPGDYTLAWTWHNKIGNREMYMNCAKVKITGAAKKRYAPANMPVSKRQQAPLPDMFIANIGNGCTVTEGTNVKYPNAGLSITPPPGDQSELMAEPVGNCGAVGAANPPAGSPASSGAASATSTAALSNSVSQVSSTTSISQSAPGVFATAPTSESGTASTQVSVVSSAASATSATSATVPLSTGTSPSGTSGTCEVGAWSCAADGKTFTRCVAGGTWSASIPMAAGMSCTPGVSMNFAYNASAGTNAKRDVRAHIARRRHSFRSPALS